MAIPLPIFKGYTVDVRLKEFRKVEQNKRLEFVRFNSAKGDKLLAGFIKTLDIKTKKDNETLLAIWK